MVHSSVSMMNSIPSLCKNRAKWMRLRSTFVILQSARSHFRYEKIRIIPELLASRIEHLLHPRRSQMTGIQQQH